MPVFYMGMVDWGVEVKLFLIHVIGDYGAFHYVNVDCTANGAVAPYVARKPVFGLDDIDAFSRIYRAGIDVLHDARKNCLGVFRVGFGKTYKRIRYNEVFHYGMMRMFCGIFNRIRGNVHEMRYIGMNLPNRGMNVAILGKKGGAR